MQWRTRKPKKLAAYTLALLWTFFFCVGFSFHYHPNYVHAHAGELQPHDHAGHFHSHEMEGFAAVIDLDVTPRLPGETHHHSETTPGSDSETLQLDFNKNSLLPLKLKVVFNPAIIHVMLQDNNPRTVWHAVHHDLPRHPTRHLPRALSGRAPPARLS